MADKSKNIEKMEEELNYLRQIKDALDKTTIMSKTDPNGIITDVNKMFERISGYKKEELIGKPHNIVRHPDMPKRVFKKLWDTIQKGKIFKGVIKNRKKDGGEYYVLANIVPIKDEKGNIKEYIAIRQDMTKRIQLQKQQEIFINNLLEYFLQKFKNPSFVINKYSNLISEELLKENPDLEKIKKYNINIKKEALTLERMYNVLRTILEFKHKKIAIHIEPLNILRILSFLFRKYKTLYNKKIKFKIPKTDVIINTDKKLIVLLLDVLYMNALRFSKSEVLVSIYEKQNKVYIIIKNDGEKIEEKLKIFDFFTQLKNKKNGSGIGMFLVKEIIDYFEYEIKIEGNQITLILTKLPPKRLLH